MSSETLVLIQQEVAAMREYFAQQEARLQNILTNAVSNTVDTTSSNHLSIIAENDKLKELQEALEKSKTAARTADGKIKLLQYQLAKSKSTTPISSSSSSCATVVKKVSFEEDKIQAASQDWLHHWMKMKPICRDIQVIPEEQEIEQPGIDETNEEGVRNLEMEISRCSEMGNMLDELGVLSESFVDTTRCNDLVADDEEGETAQDTANAHEQSTPSIESKSIKKDEDFIIPIAMCAKFFSPISYSGSESIQTLTSKYDQEGICSSAHSTACSDASKPACSFASRTLGSSSSATSSTCSLREYLAMKNRRSPCSVTCDVVSTETSPSVVRVDAVSSFSHFSSSKTIASEDNLALKNKSLVSPSELKCLFRGFQESSDSIIDSPEPHKVIQQQKVALLQTIDTVSSLGHSRWTPDVFQYASQTHHSAIHNSVQKSSAMTRSQLRNTVSSKKTVKSQSSDTKTISRLLDFDSSFISENTDESRDISCHTLTTEFDLLHNYQSSSYEMLRRRIVDVEQPLMSAKMVK